MRLFCRRGGEQPDAHREPEPQRGAEQRQRGQPGRARDEPRDGDRGWTSSHRSSGRDRRGARRRVRRRDVEAGTSICVPFFPFTTITGDWVGAGCWRVHASTAMTANSSHTESRVAQMLRIIRRAPAAPGRGKAGAGCCDTVGTIWTEAVGLWARPAIAAPAVSVVAASAADSASSSRRLGRFSGLDGKRDPSVGCTAGVTQGLPRGIRADADSDRGLPPCSWRREAQRELGALLDRPARMSFEARPGSAADR